MLKPCNFGRGVRRERVAGAKAPSNGTAGIFYVVRDVSEWRVLIYRFDDFSEEIDHSLFWERDVAPYLAAGYKLNSDAAAELALHPYGFPRGRVAQVEGRFVIYHGGDFAARASKRAIEQDFSVHSGAKWQLDDHERCQVYDRDAVVGLLGLKQTWPAVDE